MRYAEKSAKEKMKLAKLIKKCFVIMAGYSFQKYLQSAILAFHGKSMNDISYLIFQTVKFE